MAAAALAVAYQHPLPPDDPDHGRMPFLEHLEELRRRLIRACIAAAVGMLVAFAFIDRIVTFVLAPMRRALPAGTHLIFTQPGEAFGLYIEIAMLAGALLAAPYVLYQAWLFIAPGLYSREKRMAIPFVLMTSAGAAAGAAFSHYVLFPSMIAFFGTFSSPELTFMPRIEDAFDLYAKMMVGMVVVFQMPTVVFFIAKMGLVTAGFLWKNTRYAILIIFVIAAVITPSTDPWNQTVFAAPMIALYLLSIGIAWAAQPKRADDGR